jgi:hypothetical protein
MQHASLPPANAHPPAVVVQAIRDAFPVPKPLQGINRAGTPDRVNTCIPSN